MVTPLILYEGQDKSIENKGVRKYSITCVQRPCKGSNESGLLKQVVFKCRLYQGNLIRGVVSGQWSLKAVDCLIRVISNTGLTVLLFCCLIIKYMYLVKDSLIVTSYK